MTYSGDRYTRVAAALHWLIALLIVANILVGLVMHSAHLLPLHMSIGLSVLILSVLRVIWRLSHPPPALPPMPRWERLLAYTTYAFFYGAILIIPLLGWATVSARPRGQTISYLGVIPWPKLPIEQSRDTAETLGDLHMWLVWATLALVVVHIAGAVKNTFFVQDGVLWRMLPWLRSMPVAPPAPDKTTA